jgi:Na+/H+-dicarboxylate symporter
MFGGLKMISQYITLLYSSVIIGLLFLMKVKKVYFGIRVFTAMILGVAIGASFKNRALIIEPVGTIYVNLINLIKILVIPLVMASLISSITTLDNTDKLKRISFKSLGFLIATTVLATAVGLIVGKVMDLGSGMQFVKDAAFKAKEVPKFSAVIIDMFPVNVISDMANAKMIPVIIFSIFVAAAKYSLTSLLPLGKFILAMYICCFIHIVLVHGSLIAFVAKISPIRFFKKISEALVVAFTTRSSYGTLPITIRVLTKK